MSHLVSLLTTFPSFDIRLPSVLFGWHRDEDFEGKRNYMALLIFGLVPPFSLVVISLSAWWFWF